MALLYSSALCIFAYAVSNDEQQKLHKYSAVGFVSQGTVTNPQTKICAQVPGRNSRAFAPSSNTTTKQKLLYCGNSVKENLNPKTQLNQIPNR